ncbi:hypothetical protein NHX12_011016 [Muraenolepis orangiensis]|uniref:PH domain-containing protein n=1 Tax=Muraenolepis orangiensis TaxID=630683 RepID=A0A9Q0DEF4_9TELE|nr:hypothetical protein NHX12_011016 [Muraenolepis orangiensis]
MFVAMATLDGSTPVETLLTAIHLEKYLDAFCHAGLLLARDFTHLDHDALASLGIAATGHRKRILRLVAHIQRTNEKSMKEAPKANQNPVADPSIDRWQSDSDIRLSDPGHTGLSANQTSPVNFEAFRNSSAPNLAAMLTNSCSADFASAGGAKPAATKPVPKPRTVFNRRRTAPVHFSCPGPDPPPQPPRRLSQESICFTVLEGLSSPSPRPPPLPHTRDQVAQRSSCNSLQSDSGSTVPPVPPRLNRLSSSAVSEAVSQPSCSAGRTDRQQTVAASPSSLLFTPRSPDDAHRPSRRTSPSGSPRGGGMEMVSNEIYCGTLPGSASPSGGRTHCGQQAVPLPPPRQPLDRRTAERNSSSTLSNRSSGSTRASNEDLDEEISPYCETVFQSRRLPHLCEDERAKSNSRETRRDEDRSPEDHRSQKLSWTKRLSQVLHTTTTAIDAQGYSTVGEQSPPSPPSRCLPPHRLYPAETDEELVISPYASFNSMSEPCAPIICSWLDKLSPQGNYVFQKRYVKFDGKNLMYFGNEKDIYPKGVIPLAAIQMARPAKDNKFEIWVNTLQERVKRELVFGRQRYRPGAHCQKHGFLELKGTKSKVYTAIATEHIWLYKSQQCFQDGIGITLIEARGSTIRDAKHKSFELITPYKTFSFTADSDHEKREWMESLQESIAETLSDYEVAEKIWSNRSNKTWQHRGLGTMVSKVQSLKLDTSVWSNEIVQLFIMLGNDRANEFWSPRLAISDDLDCDAAHDQRHDFIALCTAVTEQNLLKTVTQIFGEAEAVRLTASNGYDRRFSPVLAGSSGESLPGTG